MGLVAVIMPATNSASLEILALVAGEIPAIASLRSPMASKIPVTEDTQTTTVNPSGTNRKVRGAHQWRAKNPPLDIFEWRSMATATRTFFSGGGV